MRRTPHPTHHLDYLDGLRALAALWVVLHHAWSQVKDSPRPGDILGHFGFFMYGRYAVDLFIVISGFCLMLPVIKADGELRGGPLAFLKRRAWRILPPYYLATALSLLLIWLLIGQPTGTHWDMSLPVTTDAILTHAVLLHDASGYDFKINPVYWSIAVEWRLYFFFPFLVLGWRYLGPVATTILALVASRVLQHESTTLLGASLTFNYLGLFACGMLGSAIAFARGGSLLKAQKLPWGWLTVIMTLVVFSGRLPTFADYMMGLWSMTFLITTSLNHAAWHHRLLSFRPLVFIGSFAYSIYLIHAPILQVLWQYPFAPLQSHPLVLYFALLCPGVPLIVALSYLFFLGCERPFLNRRGKVSAPTAAVPQTCPTPDP